MGRSPECTVAHADLFVRSMDIALDFYCDKLGFKVVDDGVLSGASVRNISNGRYETLRIVLLRVSKAGAMLELQEYREESALMANAAAHDLHTAWVSIQVADLSAHIQEMHKRGLQPSSERFVVQFSGGRACEAVFYRDPDGNGLEFLEARSD